MYKWLFKKHYILSKVTYFYCRRTSSSTTYRISENEHENREKEEQQDQQKQQKSNGYRTSYDILYCVNILNEKQIKFQTMIAGKRSCNVHQSTDLNNETRNLKSVKGIYHDLNTYATVSNIVKRTNLAMPTIRNHITVLIKTRIY